MKNQIVDLYLNKDYSVSQISKHLHITINDVRKYLSEERYLTIGKPKSTVIKMKNAVDYYEKHTDLTLSEVSQIFGVNPDSLSANIKKCGLQITDRQHVPQFEEAIFDNIDNEEKAYWLGFIYADGYIQSNSCSCFRHIFELVVKEDDKCHLLKFNTFMKHKKENLKLGKYVRDGREFYRWRWIVANKNLWNVLNGYGCTPQKSLTLLFPSEAIFSDRDLIRHFIRGYFDGDGSMGIYVRNGRVVDSCSVVGTKDFIETLSSFLPVKGYVRHNKRHDDNTNELIFSSKKARLVMLYLYKDATIYLERKYKIYKDMCRRHEKLCR